jgi:hypothetical protein
MLEKLLPWVLLFTAILFEVAGMRISALSIFPFKAYGT